MNNICLLVNQVNKYILKVFLRVLFSTDFTKKHFYWSVVCTLQQSIKLTVDLLDIATNLKKNGIFP